MFHYSHQFLILLPFHPIQLIYPNFPQVNLKKGNPHPVINSINVIKQPDPVHMFALEQFLQPSQLHILKHVFPQIKIHEIPETYFLQWFQACDPIFLHADVL
jgi:hypothetical protein